MKTRILFVIDGLEMGGGERVFMQIMNGLPAERFESLLAASPSGIFPQSAKAFFFPVDFSSRYHIATLFKLQQLIKEQQIHIIHGQGGRAEFYARLASCISGKRAYVSTLAMPVEGYDVSPWRGRLYVALDRFTEKFVDRFLVVSEVLAQSLITIHGIAAEKVVKIYNGIETELFKPSDMLNHRRRIRDDLKVSHEELLVGAIGRLVWQKGFKYFVEAMPDLFKSLPNVRFVLIGDGILRQELEGLASALNIRDRVIFTGQRTDIRDLLAAMDIVVIPSILEGFPMITLEAMAMAKPIVATAIDGITEQIKDGKEGILVPAKSSTDIFRAIKRITSDQQLSESLAHGARKRVIDEFSVQKMIESTIHVYDSLI